MEGRMTGRADQESLNRIRYARSPIYCINFKIHLSSDALVSTDELLDERRYEAYGGEAGVVRFSGYRGGSLQDEAVYQLIHVFAAHPADRSIGGPN